jgi:2-dehydro-3-deoxygluconokinase
MTDLDVITVGEAMVLFAAQETGPLDAVAAFHRSTAGAELNVAIGLARLGLRSGYVSRVGADSFGRHIVGVLDREGIDHRHVGVDGTRRTGFMLKSRSDDGSDPQIEYFRAGSAASQLGVGDLDLAQVLRTRHLHLTGIFVAVSPRTRELVFALAAAARAAGCTVSVDPNLRPSLWPGRAEMVDCLGRLAAHADWVLPGLDEGRLLTGRQTPQDIAAHYRGLGARGVVVKLGPQGAWFDGAEGQGLVPGLPVPRVVDTVGAGDGFAVGVVSALLEGQGLAQATARGNAIGARVVQFPGDCDGLPTRAQLQAFMATGALQA